VVGVEKNPSINKIRVLMRRSSIAMMMILCVGIAVILILILHVRSPTVGIVVAHYKEDLSWLSDVFSSIPRKKFYIYTKSEDKIPRMLDHEYSHQYLENVGLCDHTYLYHIIHRYYRLEDITLFVTGSAYHLESKKQQLEDVLLHYKTDSYFPYVTVDDSFRGFYLSDWCPSYHANNSSSSCKLSKNRFHTFGAFYDELVHQGPIDKFTARGIFSAHRSNIRQHPSFFYQNIISYLKEKNGQNSHFME